MAWSHCVAPLACGIEGSDYIYTLQFQPTTKGNVWLDYLGGTDDM